MTQANPPKIEAKAWWTPERHGDRRPRLIARNAIMTAIRRYFDHEGFIEIETAALQVSPGNETHLHAFVTDFQGENGRHQRYYLHTSPEFALKKLLAAGERRLFTFARAFRNRERSALHHPEFTMLEWYRAGEPYEVLMADCTALLRLAAEAAGVTELSHRQFRCDPLAAPERLTVAEAFTRYAGLDLLATLPGGRADRDALAHQAEAVGVATAKDDSWSDIFARVLAERVDPHLGHGRSTILLEYPIIEAALARPKPTDPRVAERFELYAAGVELANAFGELTDPAEQRRRFCADMDEKVNLYGERYPIDEDFLAALAIMPEACGIALGLDRLVMLATGASHIEQVLWTPVATEVGDTR